MINKKVLTAICAFTLISFSQAEHPSEAFDGYKSAILAQDGEIAVQRVTKSTIQEYEDYLTWAKTYGREELNKLSFINRFQVIIIKHRVPKERILEMSGEEIFAHAVNNDWIGKSGVIPMKADNYEISGNRAISDAIISGQKLPYKFQYINENGVWKFDLTIIMKASNEPLRQAAVNSGLTENEFIFKLVETVSGKKVSEEIWEPINET